MKPTTKTKKERNFLIVWNIDNSQDFERHHFDYCDNMEEAVKELAKLNTYEFAVYDCSTTSPSSRFPTIEDFVDNCNDEFYDTNNLWMTTLHCKNEDFDIEDYYNILNGGKKLKPLELEDGLHALAYDYCTEEHAQITSFHGDSIKASRAELKKILGGPAYEENDPNEKTQCEWHIAKVDGDNITTFGFLYDWKEYELYPEDKTINWHIGAANKEDSAEILKWLNEKRNNK